MTTTKITFAALAIAGMMATMAPMAGAETADNSTAATSFEVNEKFAFVDGNPNYITEREIAATVSVGDVLIVNTSDAYTDRSSSAQDNERINVYGVANGERTLIGTTRDLVDGVDDVADSIDFISNGDYDSIYLELFDDHSSANSVFVNGIVVRPGAPVVTPEPEEIPMPNEMIETTPDAPIDPPVDPPVDEVMISTPDEVTIPAPVIEEAPMTELPLTGTSETLAMGAVGVLMALFGWGMVELAKAD